MDSGANIAPNAWREEVVMKEFILFLEDCMVSALHLILERRIHCT